MAGVMQEVENLAECEAILRDKNRGMSTSAICEKWMISLPTMKRRIRVALDANRIDDIVEYREREMAACDDLIERWQGQLLIAEQMAHEAITQDPPSLDALAAAARIRADALNGMLRVRERRARLAGADAPVKVSATVVHHDARDLELAEMVRLAKSRDRATA